MFHIPTKPKIAWIDVWRKPRINKLATDGTYFYEVFFLDIHNVCRVSTLLKNCVWRSPVCFNKDAYCCSMIKHVTVPLALNYLKIYDPRIKNAVHLYHNVTFGDCNGACEVWLGSRIWQLWVFMEPCCTCEEDTPRLLSINPKASKKLTWEPVSSLKIYCCSFCTS